MFNYRNDFQLAAHAVIPAQLPAQLPARRYTIVCVGTWTFRHAGKVVAPVSQTAVGTVALSPVHAFHFYRELGLVLSRWSTSADLCLLTQ